MESPAVQVVFAFVVSYLPALVTMFFCDLAFTILGPKTLGNNPIRHFGNFLGGAIVVWIWWQVFVEPATLNDPIGWQVFLGVILAILSNSHKVIWTHSILAQNELIRYRDIDRVALPNGRTYIQRLRNTVPAALIGAVIGGLLLKVGIWKPSPLVSVFFHYSPIRWVLLVIGIIAMLHYWSIKIKSRR